MNLNISKLTHKLFVYGSLAAVQWSIQSIVFHVPCCNVHHTNDRWARGPGPPIITDRRWFPTFPIIRVGGVLWTADQCQYTINFTQQEINCCQIHQTGYLIAAKCWQLTGWSKLREAETRNGLMWLHFYIIYWYIKFTPAKQLLLSHQPPTQLRHIKIQPAGHLYIWLPCTSVLGILCWIF